MEYNNTNNLVLLNLTDSKQNSAESGKGSDLWNCISTIIPKASSDKVSILSFVSLGQFDKDKIRPLRFVFSSFQVALKVVKTYQRIFNS